MKTKTIPHVSVLIDTYNHERFIERAITSVLEQDLPMGDFEILVVDDGSTDRTPELVRRFEPRVRLIRKPNGGQASAFNCRDCRSAAAKLLPSSMATIGGRRKNCGAWWKQWSRIQEVGIIGNGITEVLENGDEHSEVLHETPRFRIDSLQGARIFRRRKSQLGTSRMTVKAEILRKILPVPESIVIEADEYIFTLAAALSVVSILGEPLTFYRIHAGNMFQLSGFNKESMLRKQKSMEFLAQAIIREAFPVRIDERCSKSRCRNGAGGSRYYAPPTNRWVSLGDGARGVEILPDCS